MIRVLIADDHHLVRQGILALLEKSGKFQIVGEAADGLETIQKIRSTAPDVVVMDIAMPRLNGTQALQRLREEKLTPRVIILSMHSDEALVRQALRLGAMGYLLKNSLKEELDIAILAAMQGRIYLSPSLSGALEDGAYLNSSSDGGTTELLTPREKEILKLIAEGSTNTQIALILNISVKTVERHRANMLRKLNVHDTAALIRYAIQFHLIFVDDVT